MKINEERCRKFKSTIMKYPIGMQSFERIIEGGFVYIDIES